MSVKAVFILVVLGFASVALAQLSNGPYPSQPPYPPNQPQYAPNHPQYPPNQPQYPPNRPQYPPNQPQYPPNQPQYPPNRPQYPPNHEQAAKSLLAEQYQCMFRYLGQLSQNLGLGHLYAQHQRELQDLINQRKACAERGILTRVLCNITQGARVLIKMSQYVEAASSMNPQFREQYFANVNRVCKAEISYNGQSPRPY